MKVWELEWSVAHTRPEMPFDATLEPPLRDGEDRFWIIEDDGQPMREALVFGIIFQELAELDYPYNDQSWPLMRQSMVDALEIGGHPSITSFPAVMIEAEIKDSDDPRLLSSDADKNIAFALSQPHMVKKDFSVLRLAPLAGVLDLEASKIKMSRSGEEIRIIEAFAFKEPSDGFPPLFRIAEQPTTLFITHEARERLKKAGIRGPVYRIPGGPPAKDEVDVPVLL